MPPACILCLHTAISLLTVPAMADPAVLSTIAAQAAGIDLVPAYLWTYAYGLYGYNANTLDVDFLSFSGPKLNSTSGTLVAVLGSNTQTMSTFMSTSAALLGLLNAQAVDADKTAAAIVSATYKTILAVDPTDASKVLTSRDNLVVMYRAAYKAAQPAARRRLLVALNDTELDAFFNAVATVSDRV